jgi:hypothetical protein
LPLLEFASVGAPEADVVQPGNELVEAMAPVGGRVRDQPQRQAAWQHEDDLAEPLVVLGHRRHLLVQDGRCVQQPLIPLAADLWVGHGQPHVMHGGRELGPTE